MDSEYAREIEIYVTYLVVKCIFFEFTSIFPRNNLEIRFITPIFAGVLYQYLLLLMQFSFLNTLEAQFFIVLTCYVIY